MRAQFAKMCPSENAGYATGQFLDKFSINQGNFVLHLGIRGDGDRMFEQHEGQGRIVQGLLLRLSDGQERLGDDTHCGNTGLFEIDGILETPGGAAASLSNPGHYRIGTGHERFQHFLAGRAGEERLLRIEDFCDALALLEQVPEQVKIPVAGLELVVVQKRNGLPA